MVAPAAAVAICLRYEVPRLHVYLRHHAIIVSHCSWERWAGVGASQVGLHPRACRRGLAEPQARAHSFLPQWQAAAARFAKQLQQGRPAPLRGSHMRPHRARRGSMPAS